MGYVHRGKKVSMKRKHHGTKKHKKTHGRRRHMRGGMDNEKDDSSSQDTVSSLGSQGPEGLALIEMLPQENQAEAISAAEQVVGNSGAGSSASQSSNTTEISNRSLQLAQNISSELANNGSSARYLTYVRDFLETSANLINNENPLMMSLPEIIGRLSIYHDIISHVIYPSMPAIPIVRMGVITSLGTTVAAIYNLFQPGTHQTINNISDYLNTIRGNLARNCNTITNEFNRHRLQNMDVSELTNVLSKNEQRMKENTEQNKLIAEINELQNKIDKSLQCKGQLLTRQKSSPKSSNKDPAAGGEEKNKITNFFKGNKGNNEKNENKEKQGKQGTKRQLGDSDSDSDSESEEEKEKQGTKQGTKRPRPSKGGKRKTRAHRKRKHHKQTKKRVRRKRH